MFFGFFVYDCMVFGKKVLSYAELSCGYWDSDVTKLILIIKFSASIYLAAPSIGGQQRALLGYTELYVYFVSVYFWCLDGVMAGIFYLFK